MLISHGYGTYWDDLRYTVLSCWQKNETAEAGGQKNINFFRGNEKGHFSLQSAQKMLFLFFYIEGNKLSYDPFTITLAYQILTRFFETETCLQVQV